jgi:diguanylate cyclase (GGDEF)-like protein/PAS domain S-box-containing protein
VVEQGDEQRTAAELLAELEAAETRFAALVENSSDIVALIHPDGTLGYANPTAWRLLGWRPDGEMNLAEWMERIHPDDRDGVIEGLVATRHSAGVLPPFTVRVRTAADGWLYLESVATNLLDNPAVRGIVANLRDVTERVRADERLAASERWFRLLAENSADFIFLYRYEPTPGFDYASPASVAITGYTPAELEADPTLAGGLVDLDTPEPTLADVTEKRREFQLHRRDGRVLWVSEWLTPDVRHGRVVAVQGIVRDISERRSVQAALEHRAMHDPLTGLANRELFFDRLRQALGQSRRPGVLFLDLDGFKAVNDRFGHTLGDEILVQVAGRLVSVIRPGDTTARYGGDEFLVLCEEVDGLEELHGIAGRLSEAFQGRYETSVGPVGPLRVSVGVVIARPDESADAVVRRADDAMYRAKRAGTTE